MFWYLMLLAAFCFGAAIGGLLFSFAGWQCVKEIESLTLQLKTINDEYPKLQKKIDKERSYSVKLTRSTIGYPTVKNHAGLIIEPVEEYREIEYYAHRNN